MNVFGLFFQVGILWLLITIFTESTNSSQSLRETWIVIIGMMMVGTLNRWLLYAHLGFFTVVLEIAALYNLIDKVCGVSQKATLKICGWYLGLSILVGFVSAAFSMS